MNEWPKYIGEIVESGKNIVANYPTPESKMAVFDKVQNLLCDIQSYCFVKGIDWQECLDYAIRHFSWDINSLEEYKKHVLQSK